jgi:hypothetical protein
MESCREMERGTYKPGKTPKKRGLGEAEEEKSKGRMIYEGVHQYFSYVPQSRTLFTERQEASATHTVLS